jgi:hypothetical protein
MWLAIARLCETALMLAHEDITLPSPGGERQRLSPESASRAGEEKRMPPQSKEFTLRRHSE